MPKLQDDWVDTAAAVTAAVRASGMSDTELARASGADYYAVRRIRREGAQNRGKNAKKLCSYFRLTDKRDAKPPETAASRSLEHRVAQIWDGSAEHRQFLENLLDLAGRYKVMPR